MRTVMLTAALLMSAAAAAESRPGAAATDPAALGLMQGSPVPPDRQVRFDDGSMWRFPKTRWAFSNQQALVPTMPIRRAGPVSPLPLALRDDLDALPVVLDDGRVISWRDSLDANFTDGILVLHRGRIVYERYLGALVADGRHIAFSVTKSFVGTLAELLIREGRIDPDARAGALIPELAASGFADATVRQLLDMRVSLAYAEDYAGPDDALTDPTRMSIAAGWAPAPAGFVGPDGNFAYAASLARGAASHGGDFVYATPVTTALQWIVERSGGAPLATQLSQRIWQPMGMEQEAVILVDRLGTAFGGGGLNAGLRDMARFGEMLRLGGMWQGKRILPEAVVRAIRTPGDVQAFAAARYPGLEGGSYRSQWWHRASEQTMAVGVHGQLIYIDPAAEMVIVRFSSHPTASNRTINPTSLPAWDAIAAHLSAGR